LPRSRNSESLEDSPQTGQRRWHQFSYYDLVANPKLRPRNDPHGEALFHHFISEMKSKLEKISVLEGLSERKRVELASLVHDLRSRRFLHKTASLVSKVADGAHQNHESDFEKILGQLDSLAATIPLVGRTSEGFNRPGWERNLTKLRKDIQRASTRWLKLLRRLIPQYKKWLLAIHPQPFDPEIDSTIRLHKFFRNDCGLPAKETEVRVAKIGNSILGWKVPFRERYEGDERWKGSTTIRQRVARSAKRKKLES